MKAHIDQARPRSLQAVRGDAEEAIQQRVTQPGIGIASRTNGAPVELERLERLCRDSAVLELIRRRKPRQSE